MTWQKATVRWFDKRSGEGMIRLADGSCAYVHYSAISPNLTKRFDKDVFWRLLFDGDEIEVKIFEDSHFRQVQEVK